MGKGSGRRPGKNYGNNYDRIFATKTPVIGLTVCEVCEIEVTQLQAGDESIDFCEFCDMIVEGHTKELDG